MTRTASLDVRTELEQLERDLKSTDDLASVLEEILRLLGTATDIFSLAYLNYLTAVGFFLNGSPHKASAYLNEAAKYAKQSKDKTLELKIKTTALLSGMSPYNKTDRKVLAMEILNSTSPSDGIHLNALIRLILIHREERNFAEALHHSYNLLIKAQASQTTLSEFAAYTQLGCIHSEVDEIHLALYYFDRARDVSQKLPQQRYLLQSTFDIASVNVRMGNFVEAIRLLRSIVKKKRQAPDHTSLLFVTFINLSNIYLLKGNSQRARHYQQAAAAHGDLTNPDQAYQFRVHSAEIEIASSKHKAAVKNLTDALAVGDTNDINHLHRHIWKLLSLTYERTGDTLNALLAYKEYSVLSEREHSAVVATQKLLRKSQSDFRIAQDRYKREHKHITYLQETISEQELAIADLSAKLSLKEKVLHDFWHDLWKQSPHLSSHFSELLKSSKLKEEAKHHFLRPSEPKKLANKFTQSLATHHPNLTPTELQVLVCARLGLSSIETASVLKTSDRTVENHRQNARKKMKLPRSTSLSTYLKSIDVENQMNW